MQFDGGVKVIEQPVSVAKSCGAITLQISDTTIERVFPHLLNDESMAQPLVSKTYSFTFMLIAVRASVASSRPSRLSTSRHLSWACCRGPDPFVTIKMLDAADGS
ncbi:hypothetical protein PF008_g22597 [Phytophthora fragariae]|uniref:Uncharacterized protein n=1 Tax=Phytophthora fragariae TaxID=53985 RepID=A0A6G0QT95_9STRA|nr:hypothetical protein PF008_g22597 [Phytophthora fragariae]